MQPNTQHFINTIYYGFGIDYLPQWGLKEALREVYQNFLDFGLYEENIVELDNGNVKVKISNSWQPETLDFLRIGNSKKTNDDAIGKHGEGLKMAFMIFSRMGYKSSIKTSKYNITPSMYEDREIGKCFSFDYVEHNEADQKYVLEFECPKDIFDEFHSKIIKAEDKVYTDKMFGSIVNKTKGDVYSGGLFVLNAPNLTRAYDINPRHLPLDRDRAAPRSFDLNWSTSQIMNSFGKWEAKDLSYDDTMFVKKIPDAVKEVVKVRPLGNEVVFTVKNAEGRDTVINNRSVIEALRGDSMFEKAIKQIKKYLAKKLGLYDLLIEFKEKHIHSPDALADFEVILSRVEVRSNETVN